MIAIHIAGMYGLAPWVGRFVERVRPDRAVAIAGVVLACGTVGLGAAGYCRPMMFVGLFLLGLGWNIGLIAGRSLVTGSVGIAARGRAQGTADLMMSLCGGCRGVRIGFVEAVVGLPSARQWRHGMMAVLLVSPGRRRRVEIGVTRPARVPQLRD